MIDRQNQLTKQIKEASDIVAVIGAYLHLTPAGAKYKGLCPFHDDSRPSLMVDPKWQNYKCWSCGAAGDVITFIEKYDKVNFLQARELLARRAGINLEQHRRPEDAGKVQMLDVLKWAAELYQQSLFDSPAAQPAREYLGERKLLGDTVRKFGLGYAPDSWDWLAKQAHKAPASVEQLVELGLLGKAEHGLFDKFRDRVMFPIRDAIGRIVGFGGRILPGAALEKRVPKYYNSAESSLFKKSQLVYGLDQARLAAQAAGYLAVVEGYTDVMMAHQAGVTNVVATMGTALGADHIRQLRRFAPRVVLVFDADAGGSTGVDRALELFIREDADLRVATLPPGLDPCDLLVKDGPEPFRQALDAAVDVLDYKLTQLLSQDTTGGLEAGRKAVEAVLGVLALSPDSATSATMVRQELMLSRVAQRFGLNQETLLVRLRELRRRQRRDRQVQATVVVNDEATPASTTTNEAPPLERQLIQVLLADPGLATRAKAELAVDEIEHPEVRRVLGVMYDLIDQGVIPEVDAIRMRLVDYPLLANYLLQLQEIGRAHADRSAWLQQVLFAFRQRSAMRVAGSLKSQLKTVCDPAAAKELLQRLQQTAVAKAS